MDTTKKPYRKIAGRPFSLFFVNRLWQGPDHLLLVETAMAQERYHRFYFNDIQALILQQTDTHNIWSFIWGGVAVLFGLIALAVDGPPYVSGTFLAVCLLLLAVNLIKGPSCHVYLQTAVQIQRIKAFSRLRKTKKILDQLKTVIETQQGVLNPSSITAKPASPTINRQPTTTKPAAEKRENTGSVAEPYRPLLHQLLFGCMLLAGISGAAATVLKWIPLAILDLLLLVGMLVLVVMALVRWYKQLAGRWVLKLTWIALALVVVQGAASYVWYFVALFQNPEAARNHWRLMQNFLQLQMSHHPVAVTMSIILAIGAIAAGVAGFKTIPQTKV